MCASLYVVCVRLILTPPIALMQAFFGVFLTRFLSCLRFIGFLRSVWFLAGFLVVGIASASSSFAGASLVVVVMAGRIVIIVGLPTATRLVRLLPVGLLVALVSRRRNDGFSSSSSSCSSLGVSLVVRQRPDVGRFVAMEILGRRSIRLFKLHVRGRPWPLHRSWCRRPVSRWQAWREQLGGFGVAAGVSSSRQSR